MNPMSKDRGLCLASTATQKGDLSALASSTDTSAWEQSQAIGHHDKVPVCTQNLPEAERSLTLFYPGRFIRNLVYALAMLRRCRPQLSLSAVVSYGKGMDILAQSAFWPIPSLTHASRLSLNIQGLSSAPGGAFLSSPWLKPGHPERKFR